MSVSYLGLDVEDILTEIIHLYYQVCCGGVGKAFPGSLYLLKQLNFSGYSLLNRAFTSIFGLMTSKRLEISIF